MNWKETTTTRYLCVQIGIVYILCWLWAQFSLFHEFFFSSCCFQVEIYCACIIYISMTHMIFLSSFPFLSLFFVDLFFPHIFDGKQSMNFFLHFFHNFFFPSKAQVCESKQAQRHPISKKKNISLLRSANSWLDSMYHAQELATNRNICNKTTMTEPNHLIKSNWD